MNVAEFGSTLTTILGEKIHEFTHTLNVELVDDGAAVTLRLNQSRMAEFLEVEGKGRLGDAKYERYFPCAEPIFAAFD